MKPSLRFLAMLDLLVCLSTGSAFAVVTISEQEPQNDFCPGQPVISGTIVSPASLACNDEDNYVFSATAGTAITVGIDDPDGANFEGMSIHLWRTDCQSSLAYDADPPPPGCLMIFRFMAPYSGDYILEVGGCPPAPRAYRAFVFCGDNLPVGACCLEWGGCVLRDRATCHLDEGLFYGEETTCDPIVCPTVPPNDGCAEAIVIESPGSGSLSGTTVLAGDDFDLWSRSCTAHRAAGRDVVYRVEMGTGDRIDLTYTQTQADGSVYLVTDCQHPYSSCVAGADDSGYGQPEVLSYVAGTPPRGACCSADGSCQIGSEVTCEATGGYWLGDWTTCEPYACNLSGACCLADGDCLGGVSPWVCSQEGGTFQGNYTECMWTQCPQPAQTCCLADGTCQMLAPQSCLSSGGFYEGGTSCDPDPCPPHWGACCPPGLNCTLCTPEECAAWGGEYLGDGVNCLGNPCFDPVGACCFYNGTCELLSQAQCAALGGSWFPFDSCDPNPCPAAAPKHTNSRTQTYYLVLDARVGASGGPWTLDYSILGSAGLPHDAVAAPSALRAAPNPFRSTTRIAYRVTQPGPVRLELFDAAGRLVRHLDSTTSTPQGSLEWDGRDDRGAAAPSGVYIVRITASGVSRFGSVIRLE